MSEPTPTLPMMRLLEPRALVAADRLSRAVGDRAAPLWRSLSTGGLSQRISDAWLGRPDHQRQSVAAVRGQQQPLAFAVPWYDKPASAAAAARRPLWPAQGIVLAAPPPAQTVDSAPAEEPRAKDVIAAYVDEPFVASPTVGSLGTSVAVAASEAGVAGSQRVVGAAAPALADGPNAASALRGAAARASLMERLVDRLSRADEMVQRSAPALSALLGPGTEERIGVRAVGSPVVEYVTATEPAVRGREGARGATVGAPGVRPVSTVGTERAASIREDRTPVGAVLELAPRSTTDVTTALPPVRLDVALPFAASAPVVQRFLEHLAGPRALVQAGEVSTTRQPISYARDMVAPFDSPSSAPAVIRSTVTQQVRAQPIAPFHELRADSGAEALVAPSEATRAPGAPAERATGAASSAPAELGPLAVPAEAIVPAAQAAPNVRGVERASTWVGERDAYLASAHAASPSSSFMPGRLAQNAELLAHVAERRVARQLGLPSGVELPSVQRSADAFTPAAWTQVARLGALQTVVRERAAGVIDVRGLALPSVSSFSPYAEDGGTAAGRAAPRASMGRADGTAALDGLRSAADSARVGSSTASRSVEYPAQAPRAERASTTALSTSLSPSLAMLAGAAWSPELAEQVVRAMSPAPRSIASIMAFADAQLGSRLMHASQPLPVQMPHVVYLEGLDPVPGDGPGVKGLAAPINVAAGVPTWTTSNASVQSMLAPALGQTGMGDAPSPVSRAVFAPAMPMLTLPGAEPGAGAQALFGVGQLGRRSEQWAGELGVRAASLAGDFLPSYAGEQDTDFAVAAAATPGMPQVVVSAQAPEGTEASERGSVDGSPRSGSLRAQVQRAPISSAEWMLLSLFPSAATAQEVARSMSSRGAPAMSYASLLESPLARNELGPSAPAMTAASSRSAAAGGLSTWVERASLADAQRAETFGARFGDATRAPAGDGTNATLSNASAAQGYTWVQAPPAVSDASAGAPGRTEGGRASLTVSLPDGRRPRGNRLAATPGMPVLHAVSAASSAFAQVSGVGAADQPLAESGAAPLWGRLRTQQPVVQAESARSETTATHTAALELVQPYVEAVRPQERSMASSFATPPAPTVPAQSADASAKSLVAALSNAGQAGGDRLTLADLTLISIISATEQVAASGQGDAPSDGAVASVGAGAGVGGAGSPGTPDEDSEVEIIAERAFGRLVAEIRQYLDNKGEPWER